MTDRGALGQLAWPELLDTTTTLLVPIGAVEQHGPHLPLDTDSRIAGEVARQVGEYLGGVGEYLGGGQEGAAPSVVVAPALHYGASGEHEGFPGTVSLGHEALHLLLLEYGRSACRWADRLVFVNGHGGNAVTLRSAVERLRYEGRDAAWFPCAMPGADAHAGTTETSVLLHLSPELVRFDRAVPGNVAPIAELLDDMRSGGMSAVSATGVLGDPTTATADAGRRLVAALVEDLVSAVGAWDVDATGRLVANSGRRG